MSNPNVTTLLIENRKGLRIIKFNNPRRRNTWSTEAYKSITQALKEAELDDTVRVVALTGVGSFYSSGNDVSAMFSSDGKSFNDKLYDSKIAILELVRTFYSFPKPLIAVVNGPAIGIATTTAALCDIVYASETAYFSTPFTSLALCPEGCSSYLFPKILGKSKANEMLMFNHKMTAEEALKFNFISEIFKPDEIEEKIWNKLERFSELSPNSLAITKDLTLKCEIEQLHAANMNETTALYEKLKVDEVMAAAVNLMSKKAKL